MLQTRLYLILLMSAVGLFVVLEVGFQNQVSNYGLLHRAWITSSSVDSGRSFAVKRDSCSTEQSGANFSTKSPKNFLSSVISGPSKNATSTSTKERAIQSYRRKASPVVNMPSSSSSSSPSVGKGSVEELKNTYRDPLEIASDRLDMINRQHGLHISPSQWKAMFYPLNGMPVAKSQSVVRVLVATYFRAGSTFLGDILQQNWKTFYHFEPLHMMSVALRIKDEQEREALNLLRNLFVCDFANSTDYVKWASKSKRQFLFHRNRFLWATCRLRPKSCFLPDFIKEVCFRASVQVMKVTRLHMYHIKQLLEDNPNLNIRVVHLVRDPRGIISSRKVLDWCNKTSCVDPQELCAEMLRDIQNFNEMRQKFPKTFFQVRYEDLSLNSTTQAQKLYKDLGLPFTPVVQRFIKTHTHAQKAEANNPYSTRRNSSAIAFEWRHRLRFEEIERIQSECGSVLEILGYRTVASRKELDSDLLITKQRQ